VAFYVPLGPRGLIFRIGSLLTGTLGGFVYWHATRRRAFRTPTLPVVPALADLPPVV
jgi:hypothetical protein